MQDPLGDCRTMNTEALARIRKARELNWKGEFDQAKLIGKATAFDALKTHDFDLLRLSYLLLADLEDNEDQQFAYLQGAYQASEFNGKIYIATCYQLIIWMQHQNTPVLLRFIQYILSATRGDFTRFLVALYAKLTNKPFDTCDLPVQLEVELGKFTIKNPEEAQVSN